MNKLERVRAVLKGIQACELLGVDYYPATGGRIAKQAKLPRVGVYRLLSRLHALELVDSRKVPNLNGGLIDYSMVWSVTTKGQEWLDSQKELI